MGPWTPTPLLKPCHENHIRPNMKNRLRKMYWEGHVSWFRDMFSADVSREYIYLPQVVNRKESGFLENHSVWQYLWWSLKRWEGWIVSRDEQETRCFWHCQFSSIKLVVLYRWWCGHWGWPARKDTRVQWKKGQTWCRNKAITWENNNLSKKESWINSLPNDGRADEERPASAP